MDTTWHLCKDALILGTLTLTEIDQPWLFCRFSPTAVFSEYAPLFADEAAALLKRDRVKVEQMEEEISRLNLRLEAFPSGEINDDIWLHIDGESAWFRF